MLEYDYEKIKELETWKKKMRKKSSFIDKASKGTQNKFNAILPDKYHKIMTESIKNMIKVVLFGSKYTTKKPRQDLTLRERDLLAEEKIKSYKNTAMIEGAGTGAGGILLGLTDFPLLLSIKIKLLYELASIYGFDIKDYRERMYILNIFQLAFSSKDHVNEVFKITESWDIYKDTLSEDINDLDWKKFQQEYRDYIDLSKMLQLVPGIGAFVGAYVNNKLVDKLGYYAMNAYRMRILENKEKIAPKNKKVNIFRFRH
ncbi:EcsC family protein [Romboutsia weinsteinii]|uniref:EcsC family protein n=1 Tax=Romboutsia weinsteinii TaxID=2020949 RepID=A0A371J6E9_9FIRM|nr:EcsC family protein [Romboutsia weinsteinii]RDY28361.1 EcsC family protein [Romboutsia weinsteinii]